MVALILLCVAAAFIGVYAVGGHYYRLYLKKKYSEDVRARLDEARSQITYVDYKGHSIPMTVLEKSTIWDNLNKTGKKAALADWKKHLKSKQ